MKAGPVWPVSWLTGHHASPPSQPSSGQWLRVGTHRIQSRGRLRHRPWRICHTALPHSRRPPPRHHEATLQGRHTALVMQLARGQCQAAVSPWRTHPTSRRHRYTWYVQVHRKARRATKAMNTTAGQDSAHVREPSLLDGQAGHICVGTEDAAVAFGRLHGDSVSSVTALPKNSSIKVDRSCARLETPPWRTCAPAAPAW